MCSFRDMLRLSVKLLPKTPKGICTFGGGLSGLAREKPLGNGDSQGSRLTTLPMDDDARQSD